MRRPHLELDDDIRRYRDEKSRRGGRLAPQLIAAKKAFLALLKREAEAKKGGRRKKGPGQLATITVGKR